MNKKAVALISGGLDSLLAARVVMDQGVEVLGVAFVMSVASSDVTCTADKVREIAKDAGINVRVIDISEEFLEVLLSPRHGYGSQMNPCIDCKIFMMRKAARIMEEEGAGFLITGEVLGERPMSQNRHTMDLIKKQSGLGDILLRPLSAKLLEETAPEKEGVVDRERLLDFKGRGRKRQIALAKKYNIKKFTAPGASCLLTDPGFAARIKDLKERGLLNLEEVDLLKLGRHFRLSPGAKVVIGRDDRDNMALLSLKREDDIILRLEIDPGPYGLLRGTPGPDDLQLAAALIISHSKKKKEKKARVEFWREEADTKIITAGPIGREEMEALRI